MDTSERTKRTQVRAYAPGFQGASLARCEQQGTSAAQVALANGLNANMIQRGADRREAR